MSLNDLRQEIIELERERTGHREALIDIEPKMRALILKALDAGIGPTELSSLSGLSRNRIYQIRDGRR